ncbi:hypothetical protein L1987_32406 [Smallanthus sonchifolius]|uniref:Uncharacterized protein n=1 Tax=Smallanthus sonchifolius TaxID=185202 RepID=A0ACB9HMI5_9ASTR|nr:hypothetical protein L1987_32406 [Smallanthus sonchifolius]
MPLATSPSGTVVSLLRSVDGSLPHGRQIGQMPQKEKEWNRISVIRSVLKAKDACVRNLPRCSVITSAKASAHSKLLKLKGNTYSTKQARHFLSAGMGHFISCCSFSSLISLKALSAWLVKHALIHRSLGFDYQGIETSQIKPGDWHSIAVILYVYGYNYLRSQCTYDVAPGGLLASVYHLTRIEYGVDQPEEVCIMVFAPRRDPRIPSVFWVWKSVDFQERESYDMLGISYDNHPRLKRILMHESWIGWPLQAIYSKT